MTVGDVLTGVAGGAILVVTAADIFRSLLVPRAVDGVLRVGPALNAAIFSLWQAAADRIPRQHLRQGVRASLAPLLLVLNMVIWAALLIVGFGLIMFAQRASFTPGFRTVGDAVYAAGSAFSTLGISGHVDGDLPRLIVLTCSVAGLAVVTVVATFLISIQTGFARRETLVLRLESHVTLPPAGIAILETYANEAIISRLGAFFEAWELWATELAISHRAFPILLLFRSNDSRCEWLAAFGAILDAAALLDATIAKPPEHARAGAHFVLRTGARVLGDPRDTLHELFARMTFNILVGNTDDHARNHAALWDGKTLALAPAYDICPQARNGREVSQAMAVIGSDRRSLIENCRLSASSFLLSDAGAREIINGQAAIIAAAWQATCDEAGLAEVDRIYLWRRQILNDYAFEGYVDGSPAGL